MRLSPLLAIFALCIPGAAQNWVTNGDFAAGLTGWTQTGFSYNPSAETWDTTGMGQSPCFACSPGGQAAPSPYPPNTLDQTVITVQGLTYELSADLACTVVLSSSVVNIGPAVTAEVGGAQVAKVSFGLVNAAPLPKEWRARLCGRFTASASGAQLLSIKFANQATLANANSARIRIDNVSLQIVFGPTCNLDGVRRINKAQSLLVDGVPGAPYSVFIAPLALPTGITIPGVAGLWYLDPATTVVLLSGTLDAGGKATTSLPIPNVPYLTIAPTWLQPAQISGGQAQIGFHHGVVFTQ
jgi:hypothetical protein